MTTPTTRWLLLIHQIPRSPAYLRAKVGKQLARIRAIPVKNSVYVLPRSGGALEDFQWIARELHSAGAEATVFEAAVVEGLTDEEIKERFRVAITPAFEALRDEAAQGVKALRRKRRGSSGVSSTPRRSFSGSARARPPPGPDVLRFDTFGGEFTHEGDRCSFEVLAARAGLDRDPGVRAVGEIIHDLDLKDTKFDRPETAGVGALLQGVCWTHPGDDARLGAGCALLDALYESVTRQAKRMTTG